MPLPTPAPTTVLEASPTAVLLVNRDGTIRIANTAAHQLFGYEPDELLGRSVDELVAPPVREHHAAYRAQFFAHPEPRTLRSRRGLYAARKDGSTFPVEIGLNPVELSEGPGCVVGVVDITARRRAERHARLLEERQALGEQLHALIRAKDSGDHFFREALDTIRLALESRAGLFGYIAGGELICPAWAGSMWGDISPGDPLRLAPGSWRAVLGSEPGDEVTIVVDEAVGAPIRAMGCWLIFAGDVVGRLHVAEKERDYDDEDAVRLAIAASIVAPAVAARLARA